VSKQQEALTGVRTWKRMPVRADTFMNFSQHFCTHCEDNTSNGSRSTTVRMKGTGQLKNDTQEQHICNLPARAWLQAAPEPKAHMHLTAMTATCCGQCSKSPVQYNQRVPKLFSIEHSG
jgi:hypothetical protein